MVADHLEVLTDRIYEAAIIPELWPALLGDIAASSGSLGLVLFVTNTRQVTRWTASDEAVAITEAWIREGWPARTKRPSRMLALKQAGWITEADIFSPEELEKEADYRGFFQPRGLGHAAGTGIELPTGDLGVFDLERTFESGPLDQLHRRFLDGLRPHLGRAVLVAARLELERAQPCLCF